MEHVTVFAWGMVNIMKCSNKKINIKWKCWNLRLTN